jgi:hypothetical protein
MDFQEIVRRVVFFFGGIRKIEKSFSSHFSRKFFQEIEENFIHKIIARDSSK